MPPYIITCPVCRKQYKLTPKNPAALSSQRFVCPNCNYAAPFSTLVSNLPSSAGPAVPPPQPSRQSAPHLATKVATSATPQPQAKLVVTGTNAQFILHQGVYILGRKSSDSQATLQLAPDISMSRQHARLTLQMVGGKLMAQIVGLKANNPVIINGKILPAGKIFNLSSGTQIRLGMTQLVFTL